MLIAIDFDGTCVTHAYPKIGDPIGAQPVLSELVRAGHKLILYTMRSGQPLDDAVNWFKDHNIPLWAVNENPEQHKWTSSPKIYAHMYIDDAAIGIPLANFNPHDLRQRRLVDRPYVDWWVLRKLFLARGVL